MSIQRFHSNQRMSQIVVHGDTIYLAGQVAATRDADITMQTQEVLAKVDALLAEVDSSKSNILSATVYLTNISDFAQMNEVWDAWAPEGNTPARACVEAPLASDWLVEVCIIAAK